VKNNKLIINKDNMLKCHLCGACVDVCQPQGAITLNESDADFIFSIESWGQLSCKDIVIQAIDLFNEELSEISESIKNI
jgi:ferredoxin